MNKLKKLLTGIDDDATMALNDLWDSIPHNPSIAWYPSAGLDFRDLVELSNYEPDLFIHTDYKPDWRLINQSFDRFETGVIEDRFDLAFRKEILQVNELIFTKKVKYFVDEQHVDFINHALETPKVFLLKVKVTHSNNHVIRPVIYFVFENINFLDEVILKYKINIKYLVKVREGCGLGGNRKSITVAYAVAANLGLEYLICDNEANPDVELIDELIEKHKLINYRFNLNKRGSIPGWSDLHVTVYSIDYYMELDWILDEIRKNNG